MVSMNATTTVASIAFSLRRLGSELAGAQKRVANGVKVTSARNDIRIWGLAQRVRADMALSTSVAASLATTRARAEAAHAGVKTVLQTLDRMKTIAADLAAGSSENVETQATLALEQEKLRVATSGAIVEGGNFLTFEGVGDTTVGTATLSVTVGQNGDTSVGYDFTIRKLLGPEGVGGLLVPGGSASFANIYSATFTAGSTQNNINTFLTAVDKATETIGLYANELSTLIDGLGRFQDLAQRRSKIHDAATDTMVDADISAETAMIKALNARQQLAYQTIEMANRFSQNILRLFSDPQAVQAVPVAGRPAAEHGSPDPGTGAPMTSIHSGPMRKDGVAAWSQ